MLGVVSPTVVTNAFPAASNTSRRALQSDGLEVFAAKRKLNCTLNIRVDVVSTSTVGHQSESEGTVVASSVTSDLAAECAGRRAPL